MPGEVLKIDPNYKGVVGGVTDDANQDITILRLNPVTKRLLVDATVILGSGVDIISFPTGNLGMQLMANSLSITPASNITDGTYIGDIRFGESLPTGSNVIGAVTQSGGWNIGTLTSITNAISANCTQITSPWIISGSVNATCTATNLDIRDLTSVSDSILIYGSDDGGTTKRVIKTDAGGAIQVDLEVDNVTVDNGAGASAVNIQDGGNTITIDGSVSVSGVPTFDLTKVAGESVQVAGGTEAKSIRVTIANDSTGLLSVDDNGASLTIDGTVTANQGGSPWQVQSNSANIATEATLQGVAGLVTVAYDYIALTYTGTNLTGVVFKTGGAGGSTVSTLTLAYTGSRLDTVTKT